MKEKSLAFRLVGNIQRGQEFVLFVNNEPVTAYPGETLATVLIAAGRWSFRKSSNTSEPRGLYCGMGICYDCLLTVNGIPNIRACMTKAQPNDQVDINGVG